MNEQAAPYEPFPGFDKWDKSQYDLEGYKVFLTLFEEAKQRATDDRLRQAINTAVRSAAIDTGAIEGLYEVDRGFTATVAAETAAWQAALEAKGETARSAFEDALAAYERILDLATKNEVLTEAAIRELHSIICRSQDTYTVTTAAGRQEHPLPKGEYKRSPNNPMNLSTGRIFNYAPVDDTGVEMHRLTDELKSPNFSLAHPVLQASYAHYAFVRIHPFADGNGRVARALASIYLYRGPGIPLVIYLDQKDKYFDALEAADEGRFGPFIGFINDRAVDTLSAIRTSINRAPFTPASESLSTYGAIHVGSHGITHTELDALAERLKSLVTQEIQNQLTAMPLAPIQYGISNHYSPVDLGEAYRIPTAVTGLVVSFSGGPPLGGNQDVRITFGVLKSGRRGFDLIARNSDDPNGALEILLRDIHPVATHVLGIKISEWVEATIARPLERLTAQAREGLTERGYL